MILEGRLQPASSTYRTTKSIGRQAEAYPTKSPSVLHSRKPRVSTILGHDRFLEVTYRKGKPYAAYLHLSRWSDAREDASVRVEKHGPYLVDWSADGRPLGIEMPFPSLVTVEDLNGVLAELHLDPEEVTPSPFLTHAGAKGTHEQEIL